MELLQGQEERQVQLSSRWNAQVCLVMTDKEKNMRLRALELLGGRAKGMSGIGDIF